MWERIFVEPQSTRPLSKALRIAYSCKLLDTPSPRIHHVDRPIGSDGDVVAHPELAVLIAKASKRRLDATLASEPNGPRAIRRPSWQIATIDYVDKPIRCNVDRERSTEFDAPPLGDVLAARFEDLHTRIAPICNIHTSRTIHDT